MKKETNNQQEEDCPFCEVSEKAVDKLKSNLDSDNDSGSRKKKSSSKIKMIFWILFLLVIGIIIGALVFYKFFPNFSSILGERNDLVQQQSTNIISENSEEEDSSPAADFVSEDVFGNKVSLSDFKGKKPVLLVFWATWCGFCTKELPDLKAFNQKHQDEIQVLVVDSGESREIIKDYIQKNEINFLVLLDEKREIWNQYLVRGTPSHFLIDKKGEVVGVWPGLASIDNLETMFTTLK